MVDNLPVVLVKKLNDNAIIPVLKHEDDAGYDVSSIEDTVIQPGERKLVGTGLSIAFHPDYVCEVVSRSGLAIKHGVAVLNAPGIVDAGYRGELKVILINTGNEPFTVHIGDRIAQLLFKKIEKPVFKEASELPISMRGEGGFGSTGVE